MSKVTEVLNTGQQATFNYDVSKTFIWNPRSTNANYTNGGGAPVTILEGTLMGRVNATGKVLPMRSDAVDGSQFPIGVLMSTTIVNPAETQNLTICTAGDVAEEKVIFALNTDTMLTIVSGKIYRDRIGSDTLGIFLIKGTELSALDTQ